MIVHVAGTLMSKEIDRVEIATASGVAYELLVPLSVFEMLPSVGDQIALHTTLVVREDAWLLHGFSSVFERRVFLKLLNAKGVGPALALGMLSALSAERLVKAIRERDIVTLQSVPRVGRKKAEQLILDLADKLDELQPSGGGGPKPEGAGADDAIRALVSLGYSQVDSERAVRSALDSGARGAPIPELIRQALSKVGSR